MWSDFIGFTFDGVHSSELNILRVSNGDRYNEPLIPEIEDKTVEANGRDGVYYYNSFYKSRDIEIDIAFDSVTEEQYRNIRRLFGQKKICKLIFDERPYKVYYAKVSEPITLETICFDQPKKTIENERDGVRVINRTTRTKPIDIGSAVVGDEALVGTAIVGETIENIITEIEREKVTPYRYDYSITERIYKGEGSIKFTCYDPFARQLYKTLDEYEDKYDNINEWAASSGILDQATYENMAIDIYQDISNITSVQYTNKYTGQFNVYNPGDIDVPYFLFIPYVNNEIEPADNSEEDHVLINSDGFLELVINPFEKKQGANENGVLINTRAELIEGVYYDYNTKSWETTGNIYNRYIEEGSFGKIVKGDKFGFNHQGIYLNCKVANANKPAIFYNYLYY